MSDTQLSTLMATVPFQISHYGPCTDLSLAKDENDVVNDFVRAFITLLAVDTEYGIQIQFLTNLAEIFPSLSKRPLILAGEDYAGTYIVSWPNTFVRVMLTVPKSNWPTRKTVQA